MALQTAPGHPEALQALASVRMSQQRPEEAKQCLEQAWTAWKDLDVGGALKFYGTCISPDIYIFKDDPKMPPIPARLVLVKLFIELSLYTPALLVLHGIMSSDDQEVEAWYLEGWCFHLMSEQAQESGGSVDGLTWEELAKDSRDCLETCQVVSYERRTLSTSMLTFNVLPSFLTKLHRNQDHPDKPLLEHTKELIEKLDSLGIPASPLDDEDGAGGEENDEWDTDNGESVDEDGDVEMQPE